MSNYIMDTHSNLVFVYVCVCVWKIYLKMDRAILTKFCTLPLWSKGRPLEWITCSRKCDDWAFLISLRVNGFQSEWKWKQLLIFWTVGSKQMRKVANISPNKLLFDEILLRLARFFEQIFFNITKGKHAKYAKTHAWCQMKKKIHQIWWHLAKYWWHLAIILSVRHDGFFRFFRSELRYIIQPIILHRKFSKIELNQ